MTNRLRRGLILCAFLAVLGFFLITEHRAHLFGVLPYLFLLACPLFHLLLHGRHGSHDADHLPSKDEQGHPSEQGGGHSHG